MDSGGGWRGCLFCYGLFGYGLFISTLHRKILYSVTYSPDRYQDSRRRVAWFCRYVFRWDDAMVDADLRVSSMFIVTQYTIRAMEQPFPLSYIR